LEIAAVKHLIMRVDKAITVGNSNRDLHLAEISLTSRGDFFKTRRRYADLNSAEDVFLPNSSPSSARAAKSM
jgi:hypothetical protein